MTPIRDRMLKAGAEIGMTPGDLDRKVRNWLESSDKKTSCPFAFFMEKDYSCECDICEAMFPGDPVCPCYQFSLSYVRRRAREALEDKP